MGTTVAPNYANLFMDRFETDALKNWDRQPLIWLRFIDDIFMIWNHGEQELKKFLEYLNNIHDKIKFTHEFSKESINFLDTTVKIDTTRELYTTLNEKPRHTSVLTLHICTSQASPHQRPLWTIPKDL